MVDSSKDVIGSPWLVTARQQAAMRNRPFVDTTPAEKSVLPFQMLRDPSGRASPVAYYPLTPGPGSNFNLRQAHLQTGNFAYSPAQVYELTEVMRQNVAASIPTLRKELLQRYLRKRDRPSDW